MPIKDNIIEMIRRNSLRAFKTLARGKGVSPCTFYPATSGGVHIVRRNLYHDIIQDTGPGKVFGVSTFTYLELNPPIKVVKELSWWKEDEHLPQLAYIPYQDDFTPEKSAIIEIPESEGYLAGLWSIENYKMYGQGVPVLWVCHVVPKRD